MSVAEFRMTTSDELSRKTIRQAEAESAIEASGTPTLSICIATYNRAGFIAETLDSIVGQLEPFVELLVVDGASPDTTESVVAPYAARNAAVRYFREAVNSGVDADYDKAVAYARGTYCWLMTDDDLLEPGAIRRVLAALADGPDLVVANARVMTADFAAVLVPRSLPFDDDRRYNSGSGALFEDVADYLSFIGGVVVRRELWLQRDRASFYGTVFIHIGVLFQSPPIGRVTVISEPLIRIRYGNAMWTSRGFEIWMFKWPKLIWSFDGYAADARARITSREPWRRIRRLVHARAIGSYSIVEYRRYVACAAEGGGLTAAWLVARMPGSLANAVAGTYCMVGNRAAKAAAYDLARSRHSTWVSRLAARWLIR